MCVHVMVQLRQILVSWFKVMCAGFMEISLEDDDCHELFITQSRKNDNGNVNNSPIFGDPMDFRRPLGSIVTSFLTLPITSNLPQYEDISDDVFDIPLSQNKPANVRWVV